MAVSTTTQELIYFAYDISQEQNTKMVLFSIFFLYSILGLWFANRMIPFKASRDEKIKFPIHTQIFVKLLRVFSSIFLILFPLLIAIFMYREYALDSLITLMVTFYSVGLAIGLILFFIYGMDWFIEFLKISGIDIKGSQVKGKLIRRKD